MACLILEYGKNTDSLSTLLPFFIIINMFEIESMIFYQLDFLTPGNMPSLANSLKQIRQIPKSRIKALPRPQRKHRFLVLVENFGFFLLLAITDVLAINKITYLYS